VAGARAGGDLRLAGLVTVLSRGTDLGLGREAAVASTATRRQLSG
jgi:hypothetical protein